MNPILGMFYSFYAPREITLVQFLQHVLFEVKHGNRNLQFAYKLVNVGGMIMRKLE